MNDNVIPAPSNRIVYVDFDQDEAKFDPELHEVVRADAFPADNAGLGYPSFTPDSNWIAYHTGEYSTGCHDGCEDDAPDGGELWIAGFLANENRPKLRTYDPRGQRIDEVEFHPAYHRALQLGNTIAVDMLGHGLTDKPNFDYAIPRYLEHLLAFLDAMKIRRASFGSTRP